MLISKIHLLSVSDENITHNLEVERRCVDEAAWKWHRRRIMGPKRTTVVEYWRARCRGVENFRLWTERI